MSNKLITNKIIMYNEPFQIPKYNNSTTFY